MKIAQILPALSNKGPVSVAYDLTCELIKMGAQVVVFYFDDKVELDFPCKVIKISFYKSVDFSSFDIIHSHCLRPNLYVALHYAQKKNLKAKLVSTLHQPLTLEAIRLNCNKFVSYIIYALDKYSHRHFDINVVLSTEQEKLSLLNLKKETVRIIGNGRNVIYSNLSNDDDKVLLVIKEKFKILGTVSVINDRKGLEQIIKGLTSLTGWFFVCVGDGPALESLKKMAKDNNVYERCLFLGYKKDGYAYYQYFDVFVMTTRSEGFPLAYIEAAANSVPTVLSNIPVLKSIVDEECALFYELDNIDDLCMKIENCYNKRAIYSSNIYSHYQNSLSAKRMTEKYLDIYNEK